MRKLIALLFLLLSGCSPSKDLTTGGTTSMVAFDFSDYAEEGFLITPQGYQGEYRSIGQLQITITEEAVEKPSRLAVNNAVEKNPSWRDEGKHVVKPVSTDKIVQEAFERASSMGADALVNWTVTSEQRKPKVGLRLNRYTVTGFAIDRIDQ